jgi:hypothetical protein
MTWRTRLGADRCPVGLNTAERIFVAVALAVALVVVGIVFLGG